VKVRKMDILPHFVFVNHEASANESGFEMQLTKPISHLLGNIVKVTISNIVTEFTDVSDESEVLVVKCDDLTLQNHDAGGHGSVLFQTVPADLANSGSGAVEATEDESGNEISAAIPAVPATHHGARVDEVCLYCLNPVGQHRLRFTFSNTGGVAFEKVKSLTATMKFEGVQ
jgi:hypothetical protein